MDKIIINISEYGTLTSMHKYYIDSYEDIFNKYGISTYIFYEKIERNFIEENKYIKHGIKLFEYESINDLINNTNLINKNIIFVNTFDEHLIDITNELRIKIGQKTTSDIQIFRNKYLQRKYLQNYNEDITIKFIEINDKQLKNISFDEIVNKIGLPFILKPISGVQSAGVSKINNIKDFEIYINNYSNFIENFKDRGYENNSILAEEYIDGDMYSVDYYVNQNGEFISTPIVQVKLGTDLGIDDFFNFSRIISKDVEKSIDRERINKFVNETIIGLGLKNTFIHHEFKLTTKNELKTIEVNGRIGGYRLEMIAKACGINMFSFIIKKDFGIINIDNNIGVIAYYSEKEGILENFNQSIIKDIESLNSFESLKCLNGLIGKKVGLTKDGYQKIASLKLINSNIDDFNSDIDFIKYKFRDLPIIKE